MMRRWVIPLALLLGLGVALLLRRPGSAPATSQGPSALADVRAAGDGPTLTSPRSRIEREADERARVDARMAASTRASEPTDVPAPAKSPVWGVLLEPDGAPVVEGWIRWIPIDPDGKRLGSLQQRVWHDGTFTLFVRASHVLELEAGSPTSRRTSFTVPLPRHGDLGSLTLEPGLSLGGRVTWAAAPTLLDRVHLVLTRLDAVRDAAPDDVLHAAEGDVHWDMPGETHTAALDATGAWREDGLEPGRYLVEVRNLGHDTLVHEGLRSGLRRIVVAPDQDVSFDLSCSVTQVVPDHAVRSADGCRDVMVSFTDEAGRSTETTTWYNREWAGDEGSFAMALRPGASYRVRVWANGHRPLEFDHVAAADGRTVVLPVKLVALPRGTVVVAPARGRSPADCDLRAEVLDRGTRARVHWDVIKPESAENKPLVVSSGVWDLVLTPWDPSAARGSDYDLPQVLPIQVEAGRELGVTWDPPQGGRFRLHVDAQDGPPRSFAFSVERAAMRTRPTVVAWDDGEREQIAWSDALVSGRAYTARDVYPAGTLTLVVTSAGCEPQEVSVRIEPRTVTPVSVTLVPR
jgi:hypothetical protein